MYDIPKELPILMGPRGIAKVEGVAHQTIRRYITQRKMPAVTFAPHTRRVPATIALERWEVDPTNHRARLAALPDELTPERAAWEVSMPVWQFEELLGHLVNVDGMVDTEDLLALAHPEERVA